MQTVANEMLLFGLRGELMDQSNEDGAGKFCTWRAIKVQREVLFRNGQIVSSRIYGELFWS